MRLTKKVLSIFLAVMLALSAIPVQISYAARDISLMVASSKSTAEFGEEIEFTIVMGSAEGTNLASVQFDISLPIGLRYKDEGETARDESIYEFAISTGMYETITIPGLGEIKVPNMKFDILNESSLRVTGYGGLGYNGTEALTVCKFTCVAQSIGTHAVSIEEARYYSVDDPVTTKPMTSVPVTVTVNQISAGVNVSLAAPVMGQAPQASVIGDSFSGSVSWSGNPATFQPNTEYTATVTLAAAQFVIFDNTAVVTVNVDMHCTIISRSESQIVFTVTFPTTGIKADVSDSITFEGAVHSYDRTPKSLAEASTTDQTDGAFRYSASLSQTLAGAYEVTAIYESDVAYGEKTASLVIDRAPLTVTGAVAMAREYDGTTVVAITGSGLSGVFEGDDVLISGISGTVANADVGVDKPVSATVALGGADRENYAITAPTNLAVTITTAEPAYTVPAAFNVNVGSLLAVFIAIAPSSGVGIGGEDVPGSVAWYSDDGHMTVATESDVESLAVGTGKVLYWTFTPASANYAARIGSTVFTIVDGAPQPLSFATSGTVNRTYGDPSFTNTLSGALGTLSYSSNNVSVATVDTQSGEVRIVGAGVAVITATAAAVPGEYAETSAEFTLIVSKRTPVLDDLSYVIPTNHTYTGLAQGIGVVTSGASVGFGEITIKYDSAETAPVNARTYLVTADIAAGDNYTAAVIGLGNYSIDRAQLSPSGATIAVKVYDGTTAADVTEVAFVGLQNNEGLLFGIDYSVDGAAFNAANVSDAIQVSGTVALLNTTVSSNYLLTSTTFTQAATISGATWEDVPTAQVYVNPSVPRIFDLAKLLPMPNGWTYRVNNVAATEISISEAVSTVVHVALVSENYNDAMATITVIVTDKIIVTEIPPLGLDKAYDGEEVTYEGEWTAVFTPENPVNAGNYTLLLTREEDIGHIYEPISIDFTISMAILIVRADDIEITSGDAQPGFTFTTTPTALYAADTWIAAPVASSPTANTETAGTYPIILSEGVLSAPNNYNVSYINGSLTVNPNNSNNDARLSALSLSDGITLTPRFAPGIMSYSTNVPNSTTSVSINATARDPNALVSGTGTRNLTVGVNEFYVIVTAGDGVTTNTYTIRVNRAAVLPTQGGGTGSSSQSDPLPTPTPTITPTPSPSPSPSPTPSPSPETGRQPGTDEGGEGIVDSAPPGAPVGSPFEDVNSSDWFFEYVMYVYSQQLMSGTSTEPMLFSPNTPMTRAMLVTVLYRMSSNPGAGEEGSANPFDDVPEDTWYSDAVKWAAENDIVSGYGSGRFGPGDSITRQDLAVILVRYADFIGTVMPIKREYTGFSDEANFSSYAIEAIEFCHRAELVSGYPDGSFRPAETATRAEIATIIMRFKEL